MAERGEVSESAFEYLLAEILAMSSSGRGTNTIHPENNKELGGGDQSHNVNQDLEVMGYSVGYRYAEKIVSTQKQVGSEPLDVVKFICKEFWEEVFKKKVDKLQTNHRGVFVLSDYKFKWLEKFSSDDMASKQAATRLLLFPCGILRGALANLGMTAVVNADFNVLPGCTFNIRVKSG